MAWTDASQWDFGGYQRGVQQAKEEQRLGRAEEREERKLNLLERKYDYDLASSLREAEKERYEMEREREQDKQDTFENIIKNKKEGLYSRYPINGSFEEKQKFLFDATVELGSEMTSSRKWTPLEVSNALDRVATEVTPDVFEAAGRKEGYWEVIEE